MPRQRNRTGGLGKSVLALISFFYSIGSLLIRHVDDKRAVRLGSWLIKLLMAPTKQKRLADYQKFYGSVDPKRDEKLEADYLQFMGRVVAENVRMTHADLDAVRAQGEVSGQEHIEAALKLGKGVLLLNSHLGNFYASHMILCLHGYQLTNVSEKIPVPSMEREVNLLRRRFNLRSVFVDKNAARAALKTFRENRIFSIVFEVAIRQDKSISLPFGAAYLDSDIGPALLAVRCGVPVLPVNVHSNRPFHHEIRIQPPLPPPVGNTDEERALNFLKTWRIWLETEIKQRPEQWWPWYLADIHQGRPPAENPAPQPLPSHAARS